MKFYGLLNGFFYVFYGLYGVLAPRHLAESTMGWAPTLLGLHQIRALWMVSIGFGIICIYAALKGNLSALTKAIILITFCFLLGRLLGLALDGAGPVQTYYEISIEIIWIGLGGFLLSRAKSKAL